MEVLVVTGGIGSGKSEVCRILAEEYGCGVYEADGRVKTLYCSHPTLLADIERLTGTKLHDADGIFVPRLLSRVIFADRTILEKVEDLVFPALMEDFQLWKERYSDSVFVVFESATILEKPQFRGFADKVMLVDAPFHVRLERACARDGSSYEAVQARMNNQTLMNSFSKGEVVPDADVVIINDGTMVALRKQVLEAVAKLYENKFNDK